MNRHKHTDWQFEYRCSCRRLSAMLGHDAPRSIVIREAQLLLTAAYSGPWRAIFAAVRSQVKSAWRHYTFMKFEWARTRVLRRMPDPVLEIAERVMEEDRAVSEMVNGL